MIRHKCNYEESLFMCDHGQLTQLERMTFDVIAGLACVQQSIPICACNDIHKIGKSIGSALQKIHAIDRALEICFEDNDMTKYHEEHDREIKETATGENRWKEVLDYARHYTHKKNTKKGSK